ncbi:hypothetical protein B6K86_03025 [Lachnospiraceae bacterium]|nr:hypothetical protein B6K86_03025 [Lachnospiraceae bacterium]
MVQTLRAHKELASQLLGSVAGAFIYAVGANFFLVPSGLYSGGVFGICQLIRTALISFFHLDFGSFDIAGLIYYLFNLPVLLIAMRRIGKLFFFKTLFTTSVTSLFLSLLPITVVMDDLLSACIVGGICSGVGLGIMLRMGASGGGTDIIALLLIKGKKNVSIAKTNLTVNLVLYTICLFLFNIQIVIYSLLYSAVVAVAEDRLHAQNISVQATVITKSRGPEIEQSIMERMGRGVTTWQARGAYTHEDTRILFIALSKYEIRQMKRCIREVDPDAFIVINEHVSVDGHFLKKL